MNFGKAAIAAGVLLYASQSVAENVVSDEAAAISIGREVCRKEAASFHIFVNETLTGWHAKLEADHWNVSWGPYYATQA